MYHYLVCFTKRHSGLISQAKEEANKDEKEEEEEEMEEEEEYTHDQEPYFCLAAPSSLLKF